MWLDALGQDNVPNVVCCGELNNYTAFVCINKHFYECKDLIKAVESCFKCLIALDTIPFVSEFPWSFIYSAVYGLSFKNIPGNVRKLIQDLNDMKL